MSSPGVEHISHYLRVSDAIGTAGQPTEAQFEAIRAAGYEVVVNLAMPDSPNALPNEATLAAEQGMDYIHIPVIWKSPTPKDLKRFFAVMEEHRERTIFVHCVVNMRVSAFIFLYRVIRQGVPIDAARETLLMIWEPDEDWQRFINASLAQHGINA